ALIAAVTVFPLAAVTYLSLQDALLTSPASEFAGLANYARLLDDARFWNALGNTVYFAVVSVALELLAGLAIALLMHQAFRGRALMYGLVLLPWAVPTVVSARIWAWMYDAHIGVINYLIGAEVSWLGHPFLALNAAVVMDVWKSTPFVALLLIAGLQGIPAELYRAAAVDGASRWLTFRAVTLPMLAPFLLIAAVFRTIDAFRVFDAIYVLTGGGPANGTETLSIYAYKTLFQALEFGYGSALAVTVFLCVAVVTLGYAQLMRRTIA
ncbi:MAG TPA: sugar ABC transporter permease, partial [Steroidobacteraceae bacterium]|nr:sugar ABC transporter permease [Steroidobacteraceae bacterium]